MQGSPHWICPSSPPHKTIQGKMVPKDNLPGWTIFAIFAVPFFHLFIQN